MSDSFVKPSNVAASRISPDQRRRQSIRSYIFFALFPYFLERYVAKDSFLYVTIFSPIVASLRLCASSECAGSRVLLPPGGHVHNDMFCMHSRGFAIKCQLSLEGRSAFAGEGVIAESAPCLTAVCVLDTSHHRALHESSYDDTGVIRRRCTPCLRGSQIALY